MYFLSYLPTNSFSYLLLGHLPNPSRFLVFIIYLLLFILYLWINIIHQLYLHYLYILGVGHTGVWLSSQEPCPQRKPILPSQRPSTVHSSSVKGRPSRTSSHSILECRLAYRSWAGNHSCCMFMSLVVYMVSSCLFLQLVSHNYYKVVY